MEREDGGALFWAGRVRLEVKGERRPRRTTRPVGQSRPGQVASLEPRQHQQDCLLRWRAGGVQTESGAEWSGEAAPEGICRLRSIVLLRGKEGDVCGYNWLLESRAKTDGSEARE